MNNLQITIKNLLLVGLTCLLLACLNMTVLAQEDFFQGYQKEVSGAKFTYHSPLNSIEPSLIVRADKSYKPIVWQTEVVPADYKEKTVSFIWLYGIDVLKESQKFDVFVNGQKFFTITSPVNNEKESWSIFGKDGAELMFNRTMIDKHKDQMGFAILKLPTRTLTLGEPVNITVEGRHAGSSAWYMTYRTNLKSMIEASQVKAVSKKGDQLYHLVQFEFVHIGESVEVTISVDDISKKVTIKSGYNSVFLEFPKVEEPTDFTAQIKIGEKPSVKRKFTLEPIKEWTIHLVQHSHTDIGYTRPQTEILAEHLRYIDYALDYCDQTDHYPENSKFRWTCEASWTVREYFKSRPESQVERLLQRIKEGRIEVTGMFFNFSEIVDETALAIQTQTIKAFKERGIEVRTAMQNDVNGIGWCMIDFYKNTGVKYLIMGQHGHRAQIPFDKPTSFWWKSPSGNRLLAYRSEHYMHGNALSLTTGYIDVFRMNLTKYLSGLEDKNYPYNQTSIQFSGYETDNSPPSTVACDIVKEWNEKYEWPKLKISLASEFMNFLEENKSDYLPTQKVAWPDWWTDGFGSAVNETKASRNTHAEMIANMGLLSMAKLMGAEIPAHINHEISECYDNLLFYDEHTFGAAESITDPLAENSVIQWGEKSAYAWTAVKESSLLAEKAKGFIQPLIERSDVPTLAVFNTLNWKRSGLVTVFIDHEILPLDKEFQIVDGDGNNIAVQLMRSRNDGTYWALWVPNVPSMGYKTLSIYVSDKLKSNTKPKEAPTSLENEFYKLVIDQKKGVVNSLYDKDLKKELLDADSPLKLGEFVYEQLEDRREMERLTNSNRDTIYVPLNKKLTSLSNIRISEIKEGQIWNNIKLNGMVPGCADDRGVNIEIRLYHQDKRIEFLYDMHKLPVTDPEAVYVAFPFKLDEQAEIDFEVQGGTVSPGLNQLEGTASDWNTIQNFASVRGKSGQIVFCSNDIPLVQFGDINSGHFYYRYQPKTEHIYSWVLNNYWTTNFRASQEGEIKWHYSITSSSDNSNAFASRFGWGSRIPMQTRVIPQGKTKATISAKSVLNINIPNLLLVNSRPSLTDGGVILQVRETEGKHAIVDINKIKLETGITSILEVNALEEEIQNLDEPFLIEHFETKFLKLIK